MDKQEAHHLTRELQHFTGSETFYRSPLFRGSIYTEGVKYLADKAGCYWLIDHIFSHQRLDALKGQSFQVWKIEVANESAEIVVEDGNDNALTRFRIIYTDFPLERFTLWLVDNTLMLPSEY